MGETGAVVQLDVAAGQPAVFYATAISLGLPDIPGGGLSARPENIVPNDSGDVTAVIGKLPIGPASPTETTANIR